MSLLVLKYEFLSYYNCEFVIKSYLSSKTDLKDVVEKGEKQQECGDTMETRTIDLVVTMS
jgi:hypothetical protein